MSASERLAELGLTLPPVAAPVAAYVPAVRDGDLVHTSGQLPFVDGKLAVTGKVGSEVDADTAQQLAATCALNAIAAAARIAPRGPKNLAAPGRNGRPAMKNHAVVARPRMRWRRNWRRKPC